MCNTAICSTSKCVDEISGNFHDILRRRLLKDFHFYSVFKNAHLPLVKVVQKNVSHFHLETMFKPLLDKTQDK